MPNAVDNSFKVARSLGRSQRALRNQSYKDARGVSREFKNDFKTTGKTADPVKLIGRTDEIRSDYHKGREILRAEQKNLSRPQRVVSNMYQYPARYAAGGTATAGATGTVAGVEYKKRNPAVVKKSAGPFGVEVSKASYKETSRDPEFRRSVVHGANPRSETFVRRGTAPERYGMTLGGGTVGAAVIPVVGGGVGGTYGRRRNMKKDRVRAYRRSDKAKAQKWTGVSPDIGMYSYGKEPVKKSAFGVDHYTEIEKKRKRMSDWSSEHAKEQAAQRANIPPQRGDVPSKEVALRSPSTVGTRGPNAVSTRSAGNVANRGSSTVSRSAAGTTDEGVAGKARRGSRLKDMFRGAQHAARMNLGPAVGSDNPILAMARAQKPTAPSGASGGVKATVENVTPNNAGGTARGPGGGSLSQGGGNPFAIEGGPRGGSAPPPGGARPGASHAGPTSAPGAAPSGSARGASAFPAGAFGGAKPAGGNTAPNAGHAPQSSPPPAQAAAQAAKKFKFTAKGGGKAALATGVIGGAGALGFGAGKKEWS